MGGHLLVIEERPSDSANTEQERTQVDELAEGIMHYIGAGRRSLAPDQ